MADMNDDDPNGSAGSKRSGKTGQAKTGTSDQAMNSKDHRMLERAIRGSVPGIIGASHPESPVSRIYGDANDVQNVTLHPETHPLARQMPGMDRAVSFRGELLQCLVDPDPRRHRNFVDELLRASVPVRTLAVHLFAPVASRLGDLWCMDEADFMQVAVASTRLSMIVNHVSHAGIVASHEATVQRRVLLARTPGAQHTLGVSIVASCFRDMGWGVEGGSDLEIDDDLYTRLSRKPYDLLGISVGRVDELRQCSEAIRRVHAMPETRRVKIAVGGPGVIASPVAFQRLGADFVTRSALDVMQLASHV